jgi:Lar family restriction alleviation protein
MSKQVKLKPCPFCGGKAMIEEGYDSMAGIKIYFIECMECKAGLFGGVNKEKELEKWNRRVIVQYE